MYTDDYFNEIHMHITNIFRTIRYRICLSQPQAIAETKQERHDAIMYTHGEDVLQNFDSCEEPVRVRNGRWHFFLSEIIHILSPFSNMIWETALMFIC